MHNCIGARNLLKERIMVPLAGIANLRIAAFALTAVAVAFIGTSTPAQAQDEPSAPSRLSARIVDAGVLLRWSPPAEDVPTQWTATKSCAASPTGASRRSRRWCRRHRQSKETTYTDTTATEDTGCATPTGSRPSGPASGVDLVPIRDGTEAGSTGSTGSGNPRGWSATSGQSPSATATITQQYAMGFRLGTHGQGYEISSVSIDLAEAPSNNLTVSLWISAPPGNITGTAAQNKLFDFTNPSSFKVGLNRFTAPAGAFAYQNVIGVTQLVGECTWDKPGNLVRRTG